jgi:hypothetical protein
MFGVEESSIMLDVSKDRATAMLRIEEWQKSNFPAFRMNLIHVALGQSYPRNRLSKPIGLWDVKDPTLSRKSAHRCRQGFQPYAPAALYSPETFFYFWFIFLLETEWSQGLVRLEGLSKLKNKFIHRIGWRTRDLPVCSIVPEPLRNLRVGEHGWRPSFISTAVTAHVSTNLGARRLRIPGTAGLSLSQAPGRDRTALLYAAAAERWRMPALSWLASNWPDRAG